MKSARVIITFDCPRKCENCCNKSKSIIDSAIHIKHAYELSEFDEIMITGGEPMLYPKLVSKFISETSPGQKLLLYAAMYAPDLTWMVDLFDGIQYSIHSPASKDDIDGFMSFQDAIIGKHGSYRLHVDANINTSIPIIPGLWKRISATNMIVDSPLPENETLFILDK